MNADSPPSLLITPDRRRRLQQQYDDARRLATGSRPDFRRIHELLAECVRADPQSVLYLDAMLENLKRREEANRERWRIWSWLGRGYEVRSTKYEVRRRKDKGQKTKDEMLRQAGDELWSCPSDSAAFLGLAAAAGECEFDDVEVRYLTAARGAAPDNVETQRLLARALTRQGRFEDALRPWFAVLALSAGDAEAQQAVDDLRPVNLAAVEVESTECDSQAMLERARQRRSVGDLAAAERMFAQAQTAMGNDLAVALEREELRLARSKQRVNLAAARAEHDPHPRAQLLVARQKEEHLRLEIELLNLRAERLPSDATVRLALARRLKEAGNYSGAVQRLEEARGLAPGDAVVLVELGESWQHLRQFTKALEYYQQAVAESEASDAGSDETRLLARYRVAVLAGAMGKHELAKAALAAIATVNPEYKDVAARLKSPTLADASG